MTYRYSTDLSPAALRIFHLKAQIVNFGKVAAHSEIHLMNYFSVRGYAIPDKIWVNYLICSTKPAPCFAWQT